MGIYNLNMADENLINDVTSYEVLRKRIPRYEALYENINEMKRLQAEISTLGTFTKKTGFLPGKNFQRVATIPTAIVHAIWEVDPMFWQTPAKFFRFLKNHPEFDTTTRIA